MKNYKYLSIDPSGSGTTAIFFWNSENNEEYSESFMNREWINHYLWIKEICEKRDINIIVYETTNFIKIRGSDLTSLFKIFGAIETITHTVKNVKTCETVFVRDVKFMQKKLKEKEIKLEEINFVPGRGGGWYKDKKKINVHELDAFLVLHLYLKKGHINSKF